MSIKRAIAFLQSYLLIRILLNIIFLYIWIAGTIANFKSSQVEGVYYSQLLVHVIFYNLALLITLYANTLIFIPKFLFRKKYLLYIVSVLFCILLHTFILVFYREFIIDHIHNVKASHLSYYSAFERSDRQNTLSFFSFIYFRCSFQTILEFSLIFLGQHFFIAVRQNEIIKRQQTEIELSMLKSQINPHFLFNVLNSIYALSLKKSEQTPEVVLRLSEILRYMLYEARHEYVPLRREIRILQDYAEIEQMRLTKEQSIIFNFESDVHPYKIAPLLLIPFIENAIKHGTNSIAENAYIVINIKMKDNVLCFACTNNYRPMPTENAGGLGLSNVKKRLELIYPGQYTLVVKNESNIFDVLLTINLSL